MHSSVSKRQSNKNKNNEKNKKSNPVGKNRLNVSKKILNGINLTRYDSAEHNIGKVACIF